jgi:hypothetical protein
MRAESWIFVRGKTSENLKLQLLEEWLRAGQPDLELVRRDTGTKTAGTETNGFGGAGANYKVQNSSESVNESLRPLIRRILLPQ